MKSSRNKTIDLSVEQGENYLRRCISIENKATVQEIENKTIIGNSLEIMPLLPAAFADLVIADPPYNMNTTFGENALRRLSEDEYYKYTLEWLSLVRPIMKETGSIYVCCDWGSSAAISAALSEFFIVRNRITWQREKGRGAARNWKNSMEDIWFATVGKDYTFNLEAVKLRKRVLAPYRENGKPKDWEASPDGNYRSTCPGNFWDDITVPYWSMPENTAHPTQKPEKLLAKLILASSNAGDMVFDPFLGSGSSSVTAKKLGRSYCGIEQNPQYCLWCEKRLEMADSDKSIQGFRDGVFLERNSR
ncbi:MAG: site-specific DNA-methyltransferase [Oscillospiraceae bacterium]|nr:site-specific DNA-methyltransferase [Oscillospiraceae bacterium]